MYRSQYITFGNYCDSVPDTLNIKIQNQKIKRVNSCKNLGIYFDFNMKWDRQNDYIINKIKYILFIFSQSKKCVETNTLIIMYYAFFQSLINYGIIVWGDAYKNKLNLLQQLQTRLLKIANKNIVNEHKTPSNVTQLFTLRSLLCHYPTLRDICIYIHCIYKNRTQYKKQKYNYLKQKSYKL